MELRRELLWTLGVLVALNLILGFGAIGLFLRMAPAIERILEENVYSIISAEEILAEFASANGEPTTVGGAERIRRSLERARENVTEDEERPILARIEERIGPAIAGDSVARRELVGDLRQLIQINRDAMNAVDREARRLGSAGAWSAVFVGFVSFLSSVLVVGRLRRRLLRPLEELHEVLRAVREGNPRRRCRPADAPVEVLQVTEAVNRLLDERMPAAATEDRSARELETRGLVALLERESGPAALVHRDGRILRSNQRLIESLAAEDGETLRGAIRGQPTHDLAVTRVALGADGWIAILPRWNTTQPDETG